MTTIKEVKEKLGTNHVSQKDGVFTVRKGYFYTMGKTTQDLINRVLTAYPNAQIIDSGNHYTSFRGGAPLCKQSHWYVKFKLEG